VRRARSEFGGRTSDSGIDVDPMKPVITGDKLTPAHQLRLVYTTGYRSTLMPLSRRAWLGGNPFPPIPIPSRIPRP